MVCTKEGEPIKFYTIKLPRFIGGFVKVVMGVFKKDK
ncbi:MULTISPECIES: stage V sporulation protein SpoVM [Oceanobacillus]|nr:MULTISPECIES: stage V sporulation protein SpoVM [Oceanobacillus]